MSTHHSVVICDWSVSEGDALSSLLQVWDAQIVFSAVFISEQYFDLLYEVTRLLLKLSFLYLESSGHLAVCIYEFSGCVKLLLFLLQ